MSRMIIYGYVWRTCDYIELNVHYCVPFSSLVRVMVMVRIRFRVCLVSFLCATYVLDFTLYHGPVQRQAPGDFLSRRVSSQFRKYESIAIDDRGNCVWGREQLAQLRPYTRWPKK